MFTLDVCVCVFVNVIVKRKDGFRPILCICVYVSIDTMLNFEHIISIKYLEYFCRDVHVYKLLSKGTVEEGMNRCAENKLKLEEDVTGMGRGNWLQNVFSCERFV